MELKATALAPLPCFTFAMASYSAVSLRMLVVCSLLSGHHNRRDIFAYYYRPHYPTKQTGKRQALLNRGSVLAG